MRFLKFITFSRLSLFDVTGILTVAACACEGMFVLSAALFFTLPMVSVCLEEFVEAREVNDAV